MKQFLLILSLLLSNLVMGQSKYRKDFNEFWTDINNNYAYLKQQGIDWKKVKEIYEPRSAQITDDNRFISFLEEVLHELYNGHSSLNTNLASSNRLVPSGQDMYVEARNGRFFITDLRKGAGAESAGLRYGMEITQFNNRPVAEELKKFLPKFTDKHTDKMRQYALDMLFAGTHDMGREITALENGQPKKYYPDKFKPTEPAELLETRVVNKTTALIKINNSLGSNALIHAFDQVLDSLMSYKNIVIDLTETPGGGNTTVARAIMGRFTNTPLPYQKHEFDEAGFDTKRSWVEYVSPRKQSFRGKVYVLVGHWTGSMGEGIAIGFDGMKKATIIGTKMAGLLGAISNFGLSETKIGSQFPTERLYHVNGTPRENFLPAILTGNTEETYRQLNGIK